MAVDAGTATLRPDSSLAPRVPGRSAIGQVLLDNQVVTPEQLAIAIERQRESRRRLGHVLIDLGFTTPDAILGALSVQLGVPATRLNAFTVSPLAIDALPERVARQHGAVPLHKNGTTLFVAVASPNNLTALDDIRFATGHPRLVAQSSASRKLILGRFLICPWRALFLSRDHRFLQS